MTPAPVLVVLRPLGLGDFLTGIPAYRGLSRAFPNHRRVLAAPAALHELAMSCGAFTGCVDVEPLAPLPAELLGADVAVDLHGRGPASQQILLAARPASLISFACPEVPATCGFAAWDPDEHEVARWCRMLEGAGIACDPSDLSLRRPPAIFGTTGATLIHPGAKSESRRWPVERFAEIARDERGRGRRVLVTGSASERMLALRIAALARLDSHAVFAGTTSPIELAALVAHAGRVVSGDTGVAHLATAFDTPSVTLFGPISPAQWGPPAKPHHQVLWMGAHGDPHGSELDAGLAAIGVDAVRAALLRLDGVPARPLPFESATRLVATASAGPRA